MTDAPKRIQRKRTKGWRMPEGAVYVGRPTQWGNPFPLSGTWIVWTAVALGFKANEGGRRDAAVALYRLWLTGQFTAPPRPKGFHGAIGYADGTEVPTDVHVQGFAATVAGLTESPALPQRPSLDVLRGKDLACFCPLDQKCHADVLLELANRDQ